MEIKHNPSHIFSFLLLYLFLRNHLSHGADTISTNHPISGDQTIFSKGGIFELGFFKPGSSSNYYIGIWYKNIPERTIVWVANREKPIFDRFLSTFTISGGNLVLFDESNITIWSTNVNPTNSCSIQAVLQDDGNLVLNSQEHSPKILWQSFDHPTHTWLPGCKLGYNNKTKVNQRLFSWKNLEDPAPGLYYLELDTSEYNSFRLVWNGSESYWTSGAWNGKIFERVPELGWGYNVFFTFEFVTNANETYFVYHAIVSPDLVRVEMDVSGMVKQKSWIRNNFWSQPSQQCRVPNFCGPFGICNETSLPFCNCLVGFEPKSQDLWDLKDYSSGCSRKTNLSCGNVSLETIENEDHKDRFRELSNIVMPKDPKPYDGVGNVGECESICLKNCSCTAYSFNSSGCLIWAGDLFNLVQLPPHETAGTTLYVKLAASEFVRARDHKKKNGINIDALVGTAAGLVVFVGLVVILIWRLKKKTVGMGIEVESSLVAFEYRCLQNATNNFSERLGGGGFGQVFKGTLPDSTVVAVKQLHSASQGEKQFRTEVGTIGIIQHVNLVRLRGFCSHGTNKFLVYEYMPNGSLNSHLFENKKMNSKVLDWGTRYRIALGTARGLCYLHEKCRECIIHCDIKPDNILLDAEFGPKVADFGMAKLLGRDFSRVLTTIRGTRGYVAPEWISGVAITAKADVYSFGMMLFELLSGQRNSTYYVNNEESFFPFWASHILIGGGDVFGLLDPRLEGNADREELIRVCRVAAWCIQGDEIQRPSMGQIVQILEGLIDVDLPPLPRLFQTIVSNSNETLSSSTASSSSQEQSSSAGSGMCTAASIV